MNGKKWSMWANALLLVGALNWGLIGLFGFNLVAATLGPLARIVYLAVGWAAVYRICANGGGSDA
ncbi:DUF378 domain-containing protein [Candidatus Palauibacter sp.]|uniref:DUF378 domain-containing protein n=1 Tax=Candidatus Palauibacter sp. TaxID=3101350 RepID=UPI003AF258CC